ncbi:hypothetical protein CBM2589_B240066 [Cupriavidus taiwanensis]|uniref:Uncharacterized protein n=1 Tax=Cupriavidus taiwanensis TaxID=164546 RepID=A0A375BSD2_9BURK|nr:hypothetical protein CBM2589_B240066 [Cupriavidus taiwanensis]
MLPSPARGRGVGERAGAGKNDGVHFVEAPALSPAPLPQAGEGSKHAADLKSVLGKPPTPADSSTNPIDKSFRSIVPDRPRWHAGFIRQERRGHAKDGIDHPHTNRRRPSGDTDATERDRRGTDQRRQA